MNKELILFIAHETCRGNDFGLWEKNPFQFRNARYLIAFNLYVHIIQLLLLLGNKVALPNGQLEGIHLVVFVGGLLLVIFLTDIIFPRRVLAKAIKEYKGSRWEEQSKLIGFGYFFLNIALAVLIGIWRF